MSPRGERRQRIRHKLHTPVYASFSAPSQGVVLDLSEVLDLHEDGFAVRTGEPLELNRSVNVCLDLPETKVYVHGTGHVVWSDGEGRIGIRLSALADEQRRLIKEWLFINLLVAAANHKARTEQRAHVEEEPPEPPTISEPLPVTPVADLSSLLFAVDAVRRESRSHEGDFSSVLQLLTERALSLTGASGAALALRTTGEMVCRATAGQPAPPLQSVLDEKHGFSGECIRTACTTICEDVETDPRVDAEVCRMLGIRSIMATPIFSGLRVIGLLEVLSSKPRTFVKIHEIVLEKLAELVPAQDPPPSQEPPHDQAISANASQDASVMGEVSPHIDTQMQEPVGEDSVRWGRLAVLVTAVALVALALGYKMGLSIEKRWFTKPEAAVQAAPPETSPAAGNKTPGTSTLPELQKLAEQGNPEAQWNLGGRYHAGDGVPQDDAVAVQWFLRAAEQGYVQAQGALGAYYWGGRGVPPDLSKAYFWSALAMAQGDEISKSRVEGLSSRMTRAEILAARQQAEEWIRQHTRNRKSD